MRQLTSRRGYMVERLSRCSTSQAPRSTPGSSAYPPHLVKETSRTDTWLLRRTHQGSQRHSTSRLLTTRTQIKGVWLQLENATVRTVFSGVQNTWLSLPTATSRCSLRKTSSGPTRTTHTSRRKAE